MKLQMLKTPTPSGDYEERHFRASGDCLWVLFCPDDSEDWVSVFGRGDMGRDDAAASDSGTYSCIVAGGVAYLIDNSSRQLRHRFEEFQIQGVVAVPGRECFIGYDYLSLYAYGPQGLEWASKRISVDRIRIGSVSPTSLEGEVWTMEFWTPFKLEFEGWRYHCDWECPY